MKMLRALFPLFIASSTLAQNVTYFTGLVQTLTGLGLHQLINTTDQVANTTIGQEFIANIQSGNHTLFAPNDNSFTGRPPRNYTDNNALAAILSYHLISGSFNTTSFAPAPGHSILRTFMNSSEFVNLEGNKSQVLSIMNNNGTAWIIGQNTPVEVMSSTTYQNLIIHVITAVLDPPPKLSDVFFSTNLTMLQTVATQANLLSTLESADGITIFAPSDTAFNTALQTLGPSAMNASSLTNIFGNHLVNGTSLYSSEFSTGNWTSAAGEPFTFTTNSSGSYVTSGPSTAKILLSDIFTSNGVVHVIDNVLLNTQNNSAAANAAFSSASFAATASATQTGPVGASQSASGNGAIGLYLPRMPLFISMALVIAGLDYVLL